MTGGNPALVTASAMPSWVAEAACSSSDPELFFDKGQDLVTMPASRDLSHDNVKRRELAKRVCRSCPVVLKCREFFMNEVHGVFGGLDRDERTELRKASRAMGEDRIDPAQLGREAFEAQQAGETMTEIAQRHGMRNRQVRAYLNTFLCTPEGLRLQLEYTIRAYWEQGLSDREMAMKLNIPIAKVIYIRTRLGLLEERVSQGPVKLGNDRESSVVVMGTTLRAVYLGESADDPPFFFMQVKYPQASTRKWMRAEDVLLGQGVRRHVISKGVGSGKKRTADSAGDRTRSSGEAVA